MACSFYIEESQDADEMGHAHNMYEIPQRIPYTCSYSHSDSFNGDLHVPLVKLEFILME